MTADDIAELLREAAQQAQALREQARYYDGRADLAREIIERLRQAAQAPPADPPPVAEEN